MNFGGNGRSPLPALHACIAYNVCIQYTIRNVPEALDEALRRAARERGKSLNEVAIEALARGAGFIEEAAHIAIGRHRRHLTQRCRFRERIGRARYYRRRGVAVRLALDANRYTDLLCGRLRASRERVRTGEQ